ncbi:monovalent cation/H+ antiporter complex subunit F [uncultured Schumannella sp.]|uniref:monovalent cation/H+ antiporter complex subunit F n=1 Tax=uncultured Schumannella sp. TaxID=1195956 RepID=UPI0025DDACF3|nr:monovalent cation/H+ antiporter complex subunit F [uncultured Schumannella sp.]
MTVLLTIAGAIFALSALLAVIRVVLGPTVLDRMIAADVLLTIVLLVVGAEMVVSGHTRNLVVMLVIAVSASIATIAVSRFVSQRPSEQQPAERTEADR